MTIDNTASSVICFKNGYSYVNIPVELEDNSKKDIKECNVGPLPSFAVHGTVSLQADNADEVKILSVAQAQEEDLDLRLPTGEDFSYAAFLKANIGRPIKLILVREEKSGQGASTTNEVHGIVTWIKEGTDQSLAILKAQDKSNVLIDCSKVVQIETSTVTLKNEDEVKSLVVRFKGERETVASHKATLSFLTRGLTWAPSYTLILNQIKKTMKMEGKARLLCDLPFFKGNVIRDVSLVAGKPKMECGSLSDPLASGEGAQSFIDQLLNQGQAGHNSATRTKVSKGYTRRMNYCLSSRRRMSEDYLEDDRGSDYDFIGDDLEEGIKGGETVEDFYHYKLSNVPIKHNQPLNMDFIKESNDLDYEDIYYIDLNKEALRSSHDNAKHDEDVVEAIHAISFKNVSGQPLTSAPVSVLVKKATEEGEDGETINENNFMVQGMLKFTPPGKSATVEITRAMDVDGKFTVETSKERKTERVTEGSGSLFKSGPKKKYADSVESKAKVVVNNSKNEEIKCKLECVLRGHLETSKPEPTEKTEKKQSNSHILNPTTKYVWEIKVPPKKKGEVNFIFAVKEWN